MVIARHLPTTSFSSLAIAQVPRGNSASGKVFGVHNRDLVNVARLAEGGCALALLVEQEKATQVGPDGKR
jgi:hypothetical protein